MGPRSIDRGNAEMTHDQRVAYAASMGPRSIDRGNGTLRTVSGRMGTASMGPRSIDRGNRWCGVGCAARPTCFNGAAIN